MPYRPPRVSEDELLRSNPNGVMTEAQVEAFLWGFFGAAARSRDRRIAGATVRVNPENGLPESAGDLAPSHRAVYGPELALQMILPPEDFAAMHVATRELPQNVGVPEADKEEVLLCYKHKDQWTQEEVLAVKENARRVKRVVHRLAVEGLFCTKPRLDEHEAELGTRELVHGDDGYTMGFQITPEGLAVAEDFVADHRVLLERMGILDGAGRTIAARSQDWLKAESRLRAAAV